LTARHSRWGDVAGSIGEKDRVVTALSPGDTISLEFSALPLPVGKVRDWFLVSTGVYTSDVLGSSQKNVGSSMPPRFALAQNRPNPFSKSTTIRFELPAASRVRLDVFDLLGRRLATLADQQFSAGVHSVDWDRTTVNGLPVSPGIYLYRMSAGTFRDQKKMILLP
jgi:hypothetical protein